ncbi:MAG: 50S ribosomal protein L3 [Candidatus Diapherotrites archaeon]|nr:50S ribosomal protein L3 [Candidatus Diapherotrites archaeon]
MGKKHKPREGSMAFYPRKRALKETPVFTSFKTVSKIEGVKPLNFFGYKAGMVHVMAKNDHAKSHKKGMTMQIPCTVLECPPLKVFGVRAYTKDSYGSHVLGEVLTAKLDKNLARRQQSFAKKKKEHKIEDLEARKSEISEVHLLVHTNPAMTTMGKKKPAISEIALSGTPEEQFNFAKSKLGQELKAQDVFKDSQFVDVKAVTKGFGTTGPVKRFGVKVFGRKGKYHRKPGTYGPWNPSSIMFTVARAGQHGYHARVEFNKKVLLISSDFKKINPSAGFEDYGDLRNDFILIAGSTPGIVKRLIALREPARKTLESKWKIGPIESFSTQPSTGVAL